MEAMDDRHTCRECFWYWSAHNSEYASSGCDHPTSFGKKWNAVIGERTVRIRSAHPSLKNATGRCTDWRAHPKLTWFQRLMRAIGFGSNTGCGYEWDAKAGT